MAETLSNSAGEQSERDEILETLLAGMQELREDVETADPDSVREEQLQLRRYHELGYLANQYRKLKKDTDLNEMAERLAYLEEDFDQ